MERKTKIIFDPIPHTYTDETGLQYTSATTLIGNYEEVFNKKYWSMYSALKNNGYSVRPVEDFTAIWVNNKFVFLDELYYNPINCKEVKALIKEWDETTVIACNRGNKIHDFLEDSINLSKGDIKGETNDVITPTLTANLASAGLEVMLKCKHDLDKTDIQSAYPCVYDKLLHYINLGCTIYAEKKVYTTTYQIAGMIDVLIIKGKQFAILDWKTNKAKMNFRSGYYKKVLVKGKWVKSPTYILRSKRLKYPVNNLEACKGIVYTLQLSLYAYIMELWGFTLVKDGLEICHIRPNLKPKYLKIEYKKEDIKRMLQHNIGKLPNNNNNNNKLNFGIWKS